MSFGCPKSRKTVEKYIEQDKMFKNKKKVLKISGITKLLKLQSKSEDLVALDL